MNSGNTSAEDARSGDAERGVSRAAKVENALLQHPGVREAAVIDGDSGMTAFVAPDDGYLDGVMGRNAAEATALGKWRKVYDLTQFTREYDTRPHQISSKTAFRACIVP